MHTSLAASGARRVCSRLYLSSVGGPEEPPVMSGTATGNVRFGSSGAGKKKKKNHKESASESLGADYRLFL